MFMANPDHVQKELQALVEETLHLRERLRAVEVRLQQLSEATAPAALPPPAMSVVPPLPRAVLLPPPLPPVVESAPPPLPEIAPVGAMATMGQTEAVDAQSSESLATDPSTHAATPLPPPLPPHFPPVRALPPLPVAPSVPSVPQASPALPKPAAKEESFELQIFVYWGVRVAIGLLLIGFVYAAVYLYQTHIPRLGAGAKMTLLYLGSGALLGLGQWLRPRAAGEPRLRTFAAIVEGGGFGALYFTTLAGHAFERLRIYESPLLTMLLLFALGAFVLWWSERREAPPLATVALLSAGFSAAVLPGSWTALAGTALFTALGVGQWWRLGWVGPSVASLVASYGAYGWWRYQATYSRAPEGSFAIECLLLTLYWVIFTFGVFAPRAARGALRTAFLTANNVAAYCLLARLIAQEYPQWFWRFTLAAGVGFLFLAALAHRRLGPAEANAYRVQGLILGTLAIVSYFSGWQLGLMLCLESLALAAAASWRDSRLFLAAGWLAGALGILAQLDFAALSTTAALAGGGASAALLLGAAWICLHRPLAEAQSHPRWFGAAAEIWSILAAVLGALLLGREASGHGSSWLAGALGLWGLGLLLAHTAVRTHALPIAGFVVHLGATAVWISREVEHWLQRAPLTEPWLPLLLLALGLGHDLLRRGRETLQEIPTSVVVMAASAFALRHFVGWNAWCLAAPALAAGWILYGWRFRDRTFAVGALALSVTASALGLLRELDGYGPGLWPLLALMLTPLALRALAERLATQANAEHDLAFVACFRLAVALTAAQLFLWVLVAVPDPWKPLAFAGLALAAAALGRWRAFEAGPAVAAGAIALTLLFVLAGFSGRLHWSQATALVAAFAASEWVRGGSLSETLANLVGLLRLGLLAAGFVWISLRLHSSANAALFTAIGWTLYALLLMVVGLWRRDRQVRFAALAVFALTIGRVLVYEAWSLGPLYRMASFMVLGLVLLGLGWVFTKYQDKLREWL